MSAVELPSTIVRNRGLLWSMAARELRRRYASSLLGPAWLFLHPALLALIFWCVFKGIVKVPGGGERGGYVLYLLAGLLPWMNLEETIRRGSGVFVENASVLKNMALRKELLVVAFLFEQAFLLLVALLVLVLLSLILGVSPGPSLLLLAPVMALQTILAYGLVLAVATVNVFLRDMAHAVTVLLVMAFWTTPICYPVEILPAPLRSLLLFNPAHHLLALYRAALIDGRPADVVHWAALAAFALLSAAVGAGILKKREGVLVDEL